MACTQIYTYPIPQFIEDNNSYTECVPLPLKVRCEIPQATGCEDLWNLSRCGNTMPYYQPICSGTVPPCNDNPEECDQYAYPCCDIPDGYARYTFTILETDGVLYNSGLGQALFSPFPFPAGSFFNLVCAGNQPTSNYIDYHSYLQGLIATINNNLPNTMGGNSMFVYTAPGKFTFYIDSAAYYNLHGVAPCEADLRLCNIGQGASNNFDLLIENEGVAECCDPLECEDCCFGLVALFDEIDLEMESLMIQYPILRDAVLSGEITRQMLINDYGFDASLLENECYYIDINTTQVDYGTVVLKNNYAITAFPKNTHCRMATGLFSVYDDDPLNWKSFYQWGSDGFTEDYPTIALIIHTPGYVKTPGWVSPLDEDKACFICNLPAGVNIVRYSFQNINLTLGSYFEIRICDAVVSTVLWDGLTPLEILFANHINSNPSYNTYITASASPFGFVTLQFNTQAIPFLECVTPSVCMNEVGVNAPDGAYFFNLVTNVQGIYLQQQVLCCATGAPEIIDITPPIIPEEGCDRIDRIILQFQFPDFFNLWEAGGTHGWQEYPSQPNWIIKMEVTDGCCEVQNIPFTNFAKQYWVGAEAFGGGKEIRYQQIEIDPTQIPLDCFGFKVTLNHPDPCKIRTYFLEPYRKNTCAQLPTVLFQSVRNKGFDCTDAVYQEPDATYQNYFDYINEYRIPGEFTLTSLSNEIEKEGNRVISMKTKRTYRLRSYPLPPYVIEKLYSIFTEPTVFINGLEVSLNSEISKNNDDNEMWILDFTVETISCETQSIECD